MTPEPHHETAVPHFEDELWVRLDELYRARYHGLVDADLSGDVPPRTGHRMLMAVAAVAASLAIAALALGRGTSYVASGGWGSEPDAPGGTVAGMVVPGTTPGTIGSPGTTVPGGPVPAPVSIPPDPASPSPDEVKARIIAALGPGSGPWIVHQTKPGSEEWIDQVTSARRYQAIGADGRVVRDYGWPLPPGPDDPPYERIHPAVGVCDPASSLALDANGGLRRCDPGVQPPQPTHPQRVVDHCRRTYSVTTSPVVRDPGLGYIGAFLGTGDIMLDGTEEVGGRRLIRLRNRPNSFVYHIDPHSYLPVRVTDRTYSGRGLDDFVVTYEYLPRTPENLAVLTPPVPPGFVEIPPGDPGPPVPGC